MQTKTPKGRYSIKKLLFGNVTAKFMALVMALALWLYAYSASRYQHRVRLPVDIETSAGWTVGGRANLSSVVTLTYPRKFRQDVEQAIVRGRIRLRCSVAPDVEGSDTQSIPVLLIASMLQAPGTLRIGVKGFTPARLQVDLTREDTRLLPVVVRLSEPPAEYQLVYARPIPAKVTVHGAKDVLLRLLRAGGIDTRELDITMTPPVRGTNWQFELPARVVQEVVVDDRKHPVTCKDEIRVEILLSPVPAERTFSDVPISLLSPHGYPYVAEPREGERKTDVLVSGPAAVVNSVKEENIILYVDLTRLEPKELPISQPVRAHIIDTPRANELLVKPAVTICNVKISAKPAE